MFIYELTAPTGWTQVSVDRNRLVVLDNTRGGQQAGQHDPLNCSAVPDHDHVLIPQEHTHDNYHTYPADHSGKSAIAYPNTTNGNWYNDYVTETSLTVSANSNAANIVIRHMTCLLCEYQGTGVSIDEDYPLTMGLLRSLPLPTPVPNGTHMFFYQSIAPVGWIQDMSISSFRALMVSNTGRQMGGNDDPTNITSVPTHTHEISPNPHRHDIYDQNDMTDGGGGEEVDANYDNLVDVIVPTHLTIQETGNNLGACSPYWCGLILCRKEEYMKTWDDLPDDYAVTVGMLEQLLIVESPFPPLTKALFAQADAPATWTMVDVPNSKSLAVCHNNYGGQASGLLDPDRITVCPPHTHPITPNPHTHQMYNGDSDQSGYSGGGPENVFSHGENRVSTLLYPTRLDIQQNDGAPIQFYNYYAILAEKNV